MSAWDVHMAGAGGNRKRPADDDDDDSSQPPESKSIPIDPTFLNQQGRAHTMQRARLAGVTDL